MTMKGSSLSVLQSSLHACLGHHCDVVLSRVRSSWMVYNSYQISFYQYRLQTSIASLRCRIRRDDDEPISIFQPSHTPCYSQCIARAVPETETWEFRSPSLILNS
ncbi:hypothetical protein M758_5G187700 [Ceratodon purpureus]|uniref:Uncharacterized protein n=1 Tax=Ceratodon purpureus TaxID=3225 RepID=A0A8T0I3C5_CERPU|nr:hypothetical protein KC19_5G194900 [Ceratodon purpureus]KAG0617404.1 hypothetical protein M758_5G187700 [Ceratodon purpureus]